MVVPVVLVDLAQPGPPPQEVAVMLDACSRAAAPSRCVLRRPLGPGEQAPVHASVTWGDPPGANVHVEVAPAARPEQGLAQDLEFRDQDASEERWRSVGLTIGTLASEVSSRPPPVAQPLRAQPVAQTRPVESPRQRDSGMHAELAAGGVAGPGFDAGPWRLGGWARGDLVLTSLPLTLFLDATHAQSAGRIHGVSGAWSTVGLGAGVFAKIEALQLRFGARLAATGERVVATVDDPSTGDHDRGARWVPGARAGVELAWPAQSRAGLVAASDVWWTRSATDVLVHQVTAASSPNTGIVMRLGAFVSFW